MDIQQQEKLIEGIKNAICARIDERKKDIIADYEKANKDEEGIVEYPLSIGVKFAAANGKASIKARLSWGIKRKSEDAQVIVIGNGVMSGGVEGSTE